MRSKERALKALHERDWAALKNTLEYKGDSETWDILIESAQRGDEYRSQVQTFRDGNKREPTPKELNEIYKTIYK